MKYIITAITIYLGLVFVTWQPSYEIVQKWTITVDTPSGEVFGSSNLKLTTSSYTKPLGKSIVDTSTSVGLYGEAPYIKLGDKYLFTLALYEPYKPIQIYKQVLQENDATILEISTIMETYPEKVRIGNDKLPIFFTFDDPQDPSTLREVDINNLHLTFGNGYDFKHVSLQLTNEDVTKGELINDFPFMKGEAAYFNYYYAHSSQNNELMKNLSKNDLIRHWKCLIKPHQVRNLTFGIFNTGISCGLSS